MRFEQLQCLQEIARTGSITAAAEKLYITQQAVSRSIKQLEEELGTTLIVRTKNGAVLTKAGSEAMMIASHILSAHDYLRDNLKNRTEVLSPHERKLCRIGSSSMFLRALSPSAISQTDYSIGSIEKTDNWMETVKLVLEGNCDIGLIAVGQKIWEAYLDSHPEGEYLAAEILEQDRLVCVKAKRHYTWEQNFIPWNEFCLRDKVFFDLNPDIIKEHADDGFLMVPQEIGLHHNLMEYSGVLDIMPELVYQRFFSNRRFMSVMVEEVPVMQNLYQPLYHIALCRRGEETKWKNVFLMMRREVRKR